MPKLLILYTSTLKRFVIGQTIALIKLATLIVVFGFLYLAQYVKAQVVTGHVLDELTRTPVPQAVVILQDTAKERVRSTTTNED